MSSLDARLAVFLPLTLNGTSISAHTDRSWLGLVCALALAIQHVHSRDGAIVGELANLKTNFNLSYEVLGTNGNAAVAVDKAFDFLYESRQVRDQLADSAPRAMLGPAYSSLAKPIALMAGAQQVPMVSYWAASPELSKQPRYPYFTRTFPSDSTGARLLVHLLYNGSVFKGWNHVAVLYQDDEWGRGYEAQMQLEFTHLRTSKWLDARLEPPDQKEEVARYRTLQTFSFATESGSNGPGENEREGVSLALDAVKDTGASVIVVIAFGPSLVNLLEEADSRGLVTSEHAWLIADGKGLALPEIRELSPEKKARISSLISGMQSFEAAAWLQPGWKRFLRAWGSMTPAQCQHDFFTPDNEEFFATPPIEPAAYLYDGVVALALAMDAAATINGAKLLTGLKELASFDGASGPVALDDETGDREPETLQFALESFNSSLSEEPTMILAYNVSAKIFPAGDGGIEMLATARNGLQWIDSDKQPEDAITNGFIAQFEKEERDRRQEEEEAALRNRVTVAATTVGLLMAIVATLGVTICWVRVRRVALLYEVSPWQLIRDRAAAKARAVRFVFVKVHRRWLKVHRRWLKLRSAGPILRRAAVDDDDAREVRGQALLVAAGWRTGGPRKRTLSTWGLRRRPTGTGIATVVGEVTPTEVTATQVTEATEAAATEVRVEVPAPRNPCLQGAQISGSGTDRTTGDISGECSCRSLAESSRGSVSSGSSRRGRPLSFRVPRVVVPREVADPVTRRLLTACNTDWRVQPKAIDVCKAATAAQVQANLLDLEFDLPHFCSLFQKYAQAQTRSDPSPASGGGDGHGGGGGRSRMFKGLRMTEEGWLHFQREEQHEHDAAKQRELFRAAVNRRHKTPTSAAGIGPPYQARPGDAEGSTGSVVAARRDSLSRDNRRISEALLSFVEFVKLLLSPANRALDPAALLPEEGHADAPLTHFWIATSHNSYAVGHQLTGYADEAMYRRLLLQGCRSLEIDCWNGRRGEPVVTHGNTLVNKISFASVAKAVGEAAFVTSQAPVILSLEMHCGEKQQARIAELLKKELGAQLLTRDELRSMVEAQSQALGKPTSACERELPLQALQRRVLIKAKLPQLARDEESRLTMTGEQGARDLSRESMGSALPSRRRNAKDNARVVIEPSLSALITMSTVPAKLFLSGNGNPPLGGLPVSSLSEPLLLSIFATAGEDLRAEAAAKVQRITRGWQARGFPRGTRIKSDNADPLFQWGMGVQQVALNLQTNDLPTQLHHALFALGGGCGYVLKPREMRAEPPEAWPPARAALHRATITLLSLHQLPAPDEDRPALASGHRSACHKCVPELSGEYTGPSVSSVSSPAVSIELHPIGGYCRVSTALPPPPVAGLSHTTQAVERSGFNACFGGELPVHCLAAEPRETLLRVGVWDHGTLVAYETLVLGALRAGYRGIQLRSRLGTRLELCHLFVHVALGEEVNTGASATELREELLVQKALVHRLQSELDGELRARRARPPREGEEAAAEEQRPLL